MSRNVSYKLLNKLWSYWCNPCFDISTTPYSLSSSITKYDHSFLQPCWSRTGTALRIQRSWRRVEWNLQKIWNKREFLTYMVPRICSTKNHKNRPSVTWGNAPQLLITNIHQLDISRQIRQWHHDKNWVHTTYKQITWQNNNHLYYG